MTKTGAGKSPPKPNKEIIMDNTYEISDDDDSFSSPRRPGRGTSTSNKEIVISSDDEVENVLSVHSNFIVPIAKEVCVTTTELTSDEDDLPSVSVSSKNAKASDSRKNVIKKLFPHASSQETSKQVTVPQAPIDPGVNKMIGGVSVNMPMEPYGCQIALMSKVITAIKNGQNCLLESPTGSGKTLALLCSALAWQRSERARIGQILAEQRANAEVKKVQGCVEYLASVPKINFEKVVFGERSIYDSPVKNDCCGGGGKRQEPLQDDDDEFGLVKLNEKRRRLRSPDAADASTSAYSTPEKTPKKSETISPAQTPEDVRTPTIYYGARTHKQLQQVVKEFKRTSYCGEAKMTVLASRDYSCIREFDRSVWSTKNDMCRGCVKQSGKNRGETNCKYYDNRQALNHDSLPPAFDLEDLIQKGKEKNACPYYAARSMAQSAHIVFCPYNYLIEPSIRDSMQIKLEDNILIIDEAHNIEDICRDAASFSFTREQIGGAIKELEKVADSRYTTSVNVEFLFRTLKIWDDWFANQTALVNSKPLNNNEAVHCWESVDFVQTLENHNLGRAHFPEEQSNHLIVSDNNKAVHCWESVDFVQTLEDHNLGRAHFPEFKENALAFCQKLREDPRTLYGVTQSTGTLVESLSTALSYIFGGDEKGPYMEDFKPALVRTVVTEYMSDAISWRRSNHEQRVQKEMLELRLMCMNPAIVFSALTKAKCVVLASGTLTPLSSLYSELGADFPLKVAPNHPIPSERVWVGTLTTCPDGSPLECKSVNTNQPHIQDAIGECILWISRVTPHGVLCFVPSYQLMNKLAKRWQETGVWRKLEQLKTIFMESRKVHDHNEIMEDYYREVESVRGAILFAVFRGKVSEGMDFRDHQARAVVTIGIPYPNVFDMAVKEKMNYNNKFQEKKKLLSKHEWLRVQAYRALNQAVGRCVRHRQDWGAVLMVDARFTDTRYTEHLSKWVRNFLQNNHHTFDSLVNSTNSLESFMKDMTLRDKEEEF